MTFAIIPAAGSCQRMGLQKLALPWGRETILSQLINSLHQGGIESVLVVIAPQTQKLLPLIHSSGGIPYVLEQPTSTMRETVERGLCWIERQFAPPKNACWLLTPGDSPGISPTTIRAMLHQAATVHPHRILVPVYDNKRGHPTLFRWSHAAEIQRLPIAAGINELLRLRADDIVELPISDPGVLLNINTAEDYQDALRGNSFPTSSSSDPPTTEDLR